MINGVMVSEDGTIQQIGNITNIAGLRKTLLVVLLGIEEEEARLREAANKEGENNEGE